MLNKNKLIYVYQLTKGSSSEPFYFGLTNNTKSRLSNHKKVYGEDVNLTCLFVTDDVALANTVEKSLIRENADNIVNIERGGGYALRVKGDDLSAEEAALCIPSPTYTQVFYSTLGATHLLDLNTQEGRIISDANKIIIIYIVGNISHHAQIRQVWRESQKSISEFLGYSRTTIFTTIELLKKCGYIEPIPRENFEDRVIGYKLKVRPVFLKSDFKKSKT